MDPMISGRKPPPSIMRMLQQGDWDGLREGLKNGLSPNASWPGHGTLFEMFVVASSIKQHSPGSGEHQQQMETMHAFHASGLFENIPTHAPLPLSISLLMGRDDYVLALLQAGHCADGLGAHSQTPLTIFASRGLAAQALQIFPSHRTERALQHMFDHGCDVDMPGELGWRPLQLAVLGHDSSLVNTLLGRGAKPDLTDGQLDDDCQPQAAHTALALAMLYGSPESIRSLAEVGATWHCPAAPGFSAIEAAGRSGSTDTWFEIVSLLGLTHPEVIRGWWQAAAADNTKLVQWFIAAGFDAQAKDARGWNALHLAAHHGNITMCKTLVDAGLDPTQPSIHNETACDLLTPYGQEARSALGWAPRVYLVSTGEATS